LRSPAGGVFDANGTGGGDPQDWKVHPGGEQNQGRGRGGGSPRGGGDDCAPPKETEQKIKNQAQNPPRGEECAVFISFICPKWAGAKPGGPPPTPKGGGGGACPLLGPPNIFHGGGAGLGGSRDFTLPGGKHNFFPGLHPPGGRAGRGKISRGGPPPWRDGLGGRRTATKRIWTSVIWRGGGNPPTLYGVLGGGGGETPGGRGGFSDVEKFGGRGGGGGGWERGAATQVFGGNPRFVLGQHRWGGGPGGTRGKSAGQGST